MNATVSHYPAIEVTEMLVSARADLLAIDEYGNTAVHNACIGKGDKNSRLKLLMKHPDYKRTLTMVGKESKTPLQYAREQYEKQEAKNEIAPYSCERVTLIEEGKDLGGASHLLDDAEYNVVHVAAS